MKDETQAYLDELRRKVSARESFVTKDQADSLGKGILERIEGATEREIDFICESCQDVVYKVPAGYFQVGHRCLSEAERAAKKKGEFPPVIIKVDKMDISYRLSETNLIDKIRKK